VTGRLRTLRGYRWLRHHLGRRGDCLLVFGGLDLVYGWSLYVADASVIDGNATYRWFATIMPLSAWAMMWWLVGLTCFWHAFRRYDRYGYVAAIGIKMIWGTIAWIGALQDGVSVGAVAVWLGLAGLVWRISGWRESDLGDDDEEEG
jgi:hypothetical protein